MARAFTAYDWRKQIVPLDPNYPSELSVWNGGEIGRDNSHDTHYGYVHSGLTTLECESGCFTLDQGMYFCVPGWMHVYDGRGIIVTRKNHFGMFSIGGPVEKEGRLKYIDGCTDSLLIPPVKMGDPCLNLLYFPPGIDQTKHTHPSERIGIIMSGRGRCHHWQDGAEHTVDLTPGMIFAIHAEGPHKFSTPYGEDMRVLAYHPDSDFGPTDESHPMLNRTIVDGVSAAKIDKIRTR